MVGLLVSLLVGLLVGLLIGLLVGWSNLRLPIFCKVHLIYDHLAEELERYNMGTALLNESAGESLHADFDRHYQGYQVKDINATSYQEKLLHAIKTYNAGHI